MLYCCEGHEVQFLVKADDPHTGAGYTAWLEESEATELLNLLEGGECPVCSGLIPLIQNTGTSPSL